ncbi:MAG: hypothetical protein AAB227_03600 [Pseudomonadota bacterium]
MATLDAFFVALASSDADAVAALHSPGAVNVIAEPEKGDAIRYRPVTEMIDRMRSGSFPKFQERYWDPIVLERGGLAVVWTSYSIEKGGERLHCGVDIFNLSRHDGVWKIDDLNFTMEPSACDEITPGALSVVRPDFSALEAKEN